MGTIQSKEEQFIQSIAPYMQKYSKEFGYKVCSAAIAQACLESAYGTSSKAANHCNYFGLKYRPNRVECNNGYFTESSSEQRADGSYYVITTNWFNFDNMDMGAKGYYEFLNIPNYAKVKDATTAYDYLLAIKQAGYATSLEYVDNVYAVVKKWNLEQYDGKQEDIPSVTTDFTNSSLISCTILSPNYNPRSVRGTKILKITPHHMAGNLTIERCGQIFANPSRGGSSNYGIGTDGRIGLYVEEKNRAWTSSSPDNDYQAVTIEVANDGGAPDWHVSDAALESLINLCVDICQRNGIKALNYTGDKNGNLTRHNMFAATACPGPYLQSKFPYIESEVNRRLGQPTPTPTPTPPAPTPTTYTQKQFITDVQKAIGAAVDGIAGPETLSKTPTVSKTKNNRHVVVTPMQKYLNALGYNVGTVDGIAGSKFDSGLKAFQKANGCVADGEATAQQLTWKKLLGLA